MDNMNDNLLERFPRFELSYETMIYKKGFLSDCVLAIPKGPKYYAWFTNYMGSDVCIVIELEHSRIKNSRIIPTAFKHELAYGTILYGTIVQYNDVRWFGIEDIYYYKGVHIHTYNYTFLKKLEMIYAMLHDELGTSVLTKDCLMFGIPCIAENTDMLSAKMKTVPYSISEIKYRYFGKMNSGKIMKTPYNSSNNNSSNNTNSNNNNSNNNNTNNRIFILQADEKQDIYHLFDAYNTKKYCGNALIADCKTSALMNNLFRTVKENENLDALEESDSEDEFESSDAEKYVDLKRQIKMSCVYNVKFKRWMPMHVVK